MKLLILLAALTGSFRTNELLRSEDLSNPAWFKEPNKICQIVYVEPGNYTLSVFGNQETKLSMRTHDGWQSWPETSKVGEAITPTQWQRFYSSIYLPRATNLEVCIEGPLQGLWAPMLERGSFPTEYIPTSYCPVTAIDN